MDAREALRRYLEQRREMGESELVLDTLSVEDAMKMLGAGAGAASRGARASSSSAMSATPASTPAPHAPLESPRAESPIDAPPSPARAAASAIPETSDWRAAMRAAGVGPEGAKQSSTSAQEPMARKPVVKPEPEPQLDASASAVHVPSTNVANTASPLEDVPAGLTVGGASRAIFDDPAFKLNTLAEIAEMVASCRRCSLYSTAINPVPGSGNPNADFMVVGEAPGASEDEQGVPFVGAAGQLLTKILEAIQLGRDDVFIANVLKHRPPGNRNPLPDEVTACSPYLVRQIELVRPKVILALGTFASQTLLETKLTIGKLRGQIHRYYGVPLVVTYHPAALLRNPSWKRPTWEDVQLARRILDRTGAPGA